MILIEMKIPDIGDFKQVEVIEVLVKPGDTIVVDQALMVLESDKASIEVPAARAGVVREVKLKLGDKVAEGSLMLMLEVMQAGAAPVAATPASAAAPAPAPAATLAIAAAAPAPAPVPASVIIAATVAMPTTATTTHASPSVRKLAREFGVDLSALKGSGPNGRIQHSDIQAYVKALVAGAALSAPAARGSGRGLDLLPWPSLDFARFGPTEIQALPRIKKISGPNLHRNWVMIPHVTQFDEADVTGLEAFRVAFNAAIAKARDGIKLTMLAFVIKASIGALKKYPAFNASLDGAGESLILKRYYHIGFAADTPNGLVVPVVKDADKKSVTQIAQEMGELSALAREGKLKPADMQGASFTISSLGGIGGGAFTPIVNAPEVAILGLSKAVMKPVWDGNQFVPRLMLPLSLSLSYDHRVIDGAMGARFIVHLADLLADMRKTLL